MEPSVFADLRAALFAIADAVKRDEILAAVSAMESAADSISFFGHYRRFIADAVDYMTIVRPFVPALTAVLTGFSS
jgi:hypothetical protein